MTLDELKQKIPAAELAKVQPLLAQYGPTILQLGTDWALKAIEQLCVGNGAGVYATILAANSAADPWLVDQAKKLTTANFQVAEDNAVRVDSIRTVGNAFAQGFLTILLAMVLP
jgi:hypothetical protein